MQIVSHEHAVRSWPKWEVKNGSPNLILVVETDLVLDPGVDGFDSGELADFVDAVVAEFSKRQASVERVDIVPVGLS